MDLAISNPRNQSIGVIGTKATVRSHVYRRYLAEKSPDRAVVEKATPLLVPLIEEGWHNNTLSREVIEAYMSDTGFADIQALILGCTHYPLIRPHIREYFVRNRQEIDVIDPSRAVAAAVRTQLASLGLLREADASDAHQFYVSDYSQNFLSAASIFLDRPMTFDKVVLER